MPYGESIPTLNLNIGQLEAPSISSTKTYTIDH